MKKFLITAMMLVAACTMTSAGGWEQALPSGAMQFGGYADVLWYNYDGVPSSFVLNHMVLDASAELYDGVLVRAELEWAYDFGTEEVDGSLTYAYIDYRVFDAMTLRAGKFLTPFNVYNERLYRADVAKLAMPPLTYLRMADTGLQLRGVIDSGVDVDLEYAVYYVNGMGIDLVDDIGRTGIGGRLGVVTPAGFQIGFSGYQADLVEDVNFDMLGLDMCYAYETLEFRGEYMKMKVNGMDLDAFYVQAAYEFLDRYEVVVRFDDMEDIQRTALGGNYKLTDDLTFRVAYEWSDLANGISTQLAVRF